MRTIKFRQWRDGKMLKVSTICLNYKPYDIYIPGEGDSLAPIMQFTGLLDKNGKEIYEGDVLEYSKAGSLNGCKFEVKWSEQECGWSLAGDGFYQYTVVGNIYENPELLNTTDASR